MIDYDDLKFEFKLAGVLYFLKEFFPSGNFPSGNF